MSEVLPSFPKCYKEKSWPSLFCPGCGHPIVLKMLGQVIDELKIAHKSLLALDIGCSLLAWDLFDVDTIQTHHGRTVPLAAGFKLAKPNGIIIAYMGDGGAYAIGLQSLLTSAHRDDKITVIVVNNTLYAMTGGQYAPTTLCDERTTTTPEGRNCQTAGIPFPGPETLSAMTTKNAYLARGSVLQPLVLKSYLKKALQHQIENRGFSFVEALSFCPLNWKTDAAGSIKFLEKMQNYFKVGEIKCPKISKS